MAVALLDGNKIKIEFTKLMVGLEVVLENHNVDDTKLFLDHAFTSKDDLKALIEDGMKAAALHDEKQTELEK